MPFCHGPWIAIRDVEPTRLGKRHSGLHLLRANNLTVNQAGLVQGNGCLSSCLSMNQGSHFGKPVKISVFEQDIGRKVHRKYMEGQKGNKESKGYRKYGTRSSTYKSHKFYQTPKVHTCTKKENNLHLHPDHIATAPRTSHFKEKISVVQL